MYDVAIIGAGINGCSLAYEFTQLNKKVIIFDMESVAHGGSGAAGAFISPKFSKSGELKELIHQAFVYSMDYYEKNFPTFLTKAPLIHLAKDDVDATTLTFYKDLTSLKLNQIDLETQPNLTQEAKKSVYISLNTGIVDAKAICEAMAKDAKFVKQKVENISYENEEWIIDKEYKAKKLIITTGAYKQILDEPYIKLRGVWGHRIDVKTTTKNDYAIHQYVSISPTINNTLAIGATHNVHYHPETSKKPYNVDEGRAELLEKASKTIKLDNVEIIKDYMGLRSGSFDYMPIVGNLVMSEETIKNRGNKLKVKNANYKDFKYYSNLYMMNGNGGYGFVLAPYLAKILTEYIVENKDISKRITPARLFARWAKRR